MGKYLNDNVSVIKFDTASKAAIKKKCRPMSHTEFDEMMDQPWNTRKMSLHRHAYLLATPTIAKWFDKSLDVSDIELLFKSNVDISDIFGYKVTDDWYDKPFKKDVHLRFGKPIDME